MPIPQSNIFVRISWNNNWRSEQAWTVSADDIFKRVLMQDGVLMEDDKETRIYSLWYRYD